MIITSINSFLESAKNASSKHILAANTVTEESNVPMVGKLKAGTEGKYAVLKVPQDFADRVYDAIYEEGMEKPEYDAHISVMDKDEMAQLDLPILENNQEFEFTLNGIELCNPDGWNEMERVWFVQCKSPQLEKLRIQYGFTPLMNGDHEFHISIAVKPVKEMKFSTVMDALQYLSDETQQRVVISTDENWKKEIVQFLIDNPKPTDKLIHEWADERKIEHDKVEEEIYTLASEGAQLKLEGLSAQKKVTKNNVDPEQLKMGIEVEKEHSDNLATREKIVLDHLAEIPDYYTRLAKMEEQAKNKEKG